MDSVARILELIVDFLKRNYKKPKLWFAILGILVFIILIFPYIDSNTFYYTRMEKRISILEHLTQLDETTINSNPVYRQEYESILQEIQLQRERSVNSIATQLFDTVNSSWTTGKDQGNKILNFKKRSDKLVAFIVMIILSTIVGCIFMAIPIIYRSWINYFVIPIAQLVIVIVLVGKKDKKS